jgi:protein TonB
VTSRRGLLLMLTSLAAHGGVLALLALASSASLPAALFIVVSELEPSAIATGPRQAGANAGPAPTPAATPSRPTPPDPRPTLRSAPAPAAAPLPVPAPATPPEREATPTLAPPRNPEPVAAVSALREESTVDAARSSASAPVVEAGPSGSASPRGSELARGGAASDGSAVSGTSQPSPSVSAGAGTHVAVAPSGTRGGEPGAEYGRYLSRMRGRIQEALRYPPAAQRRGLKGTVLVEILIRPDGAITGVSVTSSSSHRLLDDAALEAVRSLPPQPLPPGLLPRPLTLQLPVVFDLQ